MINQEIQGVNLPGKLAALLFIKTIFVMAIFSGCTSSKTVTINVQPKGALIYVDEDSLGVSPLKTKMKFPKSAPDRIVKTMFNGYEDTIFRISYKPKDLLTYNIKLKAKETVMLELIDFESVQTSSGVKLMLTRKNSLAYLETIERSPNVKSVTRVTQNEDSTFQIGRPVMSPIDNSFVFSNIATEAGQPSFSNIWSQGVGGVGRTRITYGQNLDAFPTYSWDGEYIYFSSDRVSANKTIWKVRSVGGGGLTSITKTQPEDYAVSVFPNDKMLAYSSIPPRTTEPQIWTVNISGTLPTQLREGEFPCVSPDGKKIVYQRRDMNTTTRRIIQSRVEGRIQIDTFDFHPAQLWTMLIDGSGETQLTQNTEFSNTQPSWSPDGKWIIYSSDKGKDSKGKNNWDIWMMKADGTAETQLTTNGSQDDNPSWSYDGSRVYFRSNRGGYWNIWYFAPIIPR